MYLQRVKLARGEIRMKLLIAVAVSFLLLSVILCGFGEQHVKKIDDRDGTKVAISQAKAFLDANDKRTSMARKYKMEVKRRRHWKNGRIFIKGLPKGRSKASTSPYKSPHSDIFLYTGDGHIYNR